MMSVREIIDSEALADSEIFHQAAALLRGRIFRKHGHDENALTQSARILKEYGLDQVTTMSARNPELIRNVQDCVSRATRRKCDCVQNICAAISAIIKTLKDPRHAKKKLLEIAKAFCAELARRLHQSAYQQA